MKVILDLPDKVLDNHREMAEKKGWNRKQFMQWVLTASSDRYEFSKHKSILKQLKNEQQP